MALYAHLSYTYVDPRDWKLLNTCREIQFETPADTTTHCMQNIDIFLLQRWAMPIDMQRIWCRCSINWTNNMSFGKNLQFIFQTMSFLSDVRAVRCVLLEIVHVYVPILRVIYVLLIPPFLWSDHSCELSVFACRHPDYTRIEGRH